MRRKQSKKTTNENTRTIKTIACSFDENTYKRIEEISNGTGATKAAIVRKAVVELLDAGDTDQLTAANLIEMIEYWNQNKQSVSEDIRENLDKFMGNMMVIQGGK